MDMRKGQARSRIFLLLLCFIAKKTRAYGFGWRQGEIWGIEEPDIYMHYSLVEESAKLLREITESQGENDAPIQILITSHSPAFITAMEQKIPVRINKDGFTEISVTNDAAITGVLRRSYTIYASCFHRNDGKS